MRAFFFLGCVISAGALVAACGDSDGGSKSGGAGGTGGADSGADSAGGSAGSVEGGAGTAGTPSDAGALSVSFPQAIDGAMLANPDVYAQIPLHVLVAGEAMSVQVDLDGEKIAATDDDGDGRWTATVPMAGRADGSIAVKATAIGVGAERGEGEAELVIGARGAQITNFDDVGSANTPRLHRRGDELWLTHTDRSATQREAYLWRVDGAGRTVGDRIPLVGSSMDTHAVRTAFGETSIGVLYQQDGGPWANRLKVVDFDGNEVHPPVELDATPDQKLGSFGGDIVYDGEAFVAAYRVNDGMGGGEVRWVRVEEATGTVTGPVTVAKSGTVDPPTAMDPIGGFEPFSFVQVRVVGGISLVTFVRGLYDAILDLEIPRSQVAFVGKTGNVDAPSLLGAVPEFHFHREARVFDAAEGALLVYGSTDLLDMNTNPPIQFRAQRVSASVVVDPAVSVMVNEVDQRDEPFFIKHPDSFGVLLWIDHRSYTADILTGRLQLMVAPVDSSLAVGQEVVFEHADPIAGLGQIQGTHADTNVMFTWIDDIGGIGNPRPEIYVETAWF